MPGNSYLVLTYYGNLASNNPMTYANRVLGIAIFVSIGAFSWFNRELLNLSEPSLKFRATAAWEEDLQLIQTDQKVKGYFSSIASVEYKALDSKANELLPHPPAELEYSNGNGRYELLIEAVTFEPDPEDNLENHKIGIVIQYNFIDKESNNNKIDEIGRTLLL